MEFKVGFREDHPDTLALHCSDGRFTKAVHALLTNEHPRYDIMAMPGGPALLSQSGGSLVEVEATRGGASFLIRGHKIQHVFLIAHAGCGFYKRKYPGQSPSWVQERQVQDLQVASAWIRRTHPTVAFYLYMAKPTIETGMVDFQAVPLPDFSKLVVL